MSVQVFAFSLASLIVSFCCSVPTFAIDKPAEDVSLEAVRVFLEEGATAYRRQDYIQAKDQYTKALEVARQHNHDAAMGTSLARLGAVHEALQDHAKALELMFESLPYFQRLVDVPSQAQVHWAIGEVLLKTGRDAEAVQQLRESIELADPLLRKATREQEEKINRSLATIWTEKGHAHERLAEFANAVEAYTSAAFYFQLTGQMNEAGEALLQAGAILAAGLKDNVEGARLFAKAEAIFLESGDRTRAVRAALYQGEALFEAWFVEGDVLRSRGDSVGSLNKRNEARDHFERVFEADSQSLPPELQARALWYLGRIFEAQTQFNDALARYQSAIAAIEKLPDSAIPGLRSGVLTSRGSLLLHLAKYEDAAADFTAAAAVCKSVGDWKGEAFALAALADSERWASNFPAAQEHTQQALAIYKEHENEHEATILPQLRLIASLIELASNSGLVSNEAVLEIVLGYMKQGHALIEQYEKPLTAKEIIDVLHAAQDRFRAERYDSLLKEVFDRDDEFLKNWPDQSAGFFQGYGEANMLASEIAFMEAAWRGRFPHLDTNYFYTVGNFYQAIGFHFAVIVKDPLRAKLFLVNAALFHSSAFMGREAIIELGKDWYYLGQVYRSTKDTTRALINFYRVLVLGTSLQSPETHWVYAGLGGTYADQGHYSLAIRFYAEGLAQFEQVLQQAAVEETKSDVIAGALHAYRPLISLLLDQYRRTQQAHFREEAFRVNESFRTRGFLDLLVRSRAASLGSETEAAEKLKLEIAGLQYQLRQKQLRSADSQPLIHRVQTLRDTWRQHQEAAAQHNPRYAQLWVSQPDSLETVQHALDDQTVLLEYMITDNKMFLWAITKDQSQVYEQLLLDDEAILRRFLVTLRQPLFARDEVLQHLSLARKLYVKLIGPAEDMIRGKKRLLIVPDGSLNYLPFEALVISANGDTGDGSRAGFPGAQYLLKEYQVTYAPSASVAVELQKRVRSKNESPPLPLVAFGDPVYEEVAKADGKMSERWSRLEFSADEVRRVAALWDIPPNSPHINMREQASVKRLHEIDLSGYRFVHFATHALVPDSVSRFEQPALILSNREGAAENGFLKFQDILQLKLKADLVALSACKTSLGQYKVGEGVVGLSRAFFYAGASSLMVSLWDVQDQSTSLLMELFYKHVKEGESHAEALRQAKLSLMRSKTHLKATGKETSLESPFFWAPFIYFGAP